MTIASDGFNRADATDWGANWSRGYLTGDFVFGIENNLARRNEGSTNGNSIFARWTANNFDTDSQYAQIKVAALPDSASTWCPGPAVKILASNAYSFYGCCWNVSGGGRIVVTKTGSASYVIDVNHSVTVGDVIRLEYLSGELRLLHNGTLIGTWTDSSPLGGSNSQVGLYSISLGPSYTWRLDDFEGGDLAAVGSTIDLSPDPASVVNGGTTQITITRSAAAPAGAGVTYNLASGTPAAATVPATVPMAEGQTTATFNVTGVSVGSSVITVTNAADSNETDTMTVNVVTVRKLKLLAHIDALGATAVKGAVFAAPTGGALVGAKIGEFSGGAFKAVAESGQAPLEVAVGDFGGSALTTADTPVCVWEGTSAAGSALPGSPAPFGSNGVHECTVIEV